MERKVIAVRNSSAVTMNFVFSAIGIAALGLLIWLAVTSQDTSYRTLGIFASAVALGMALWYGIPAVLIMLAPAEVIVKQEGDFILSGKKIPLAQISEGQLKVRRKNGGQYSYGDIYVYLKNGQKIVCRGVSDPEKTYSEFCAEVAGGHKKREAKAKNKS